MIILLRSLSCCLGIIVIYNLLTFYASPNIKPRSLPKKEPIKQPLKEHPQWLFSTEKTMAFIDQLTPLIPQVTFFLNQKKLQIRSVHQSEKQWLDAIQKTHQSASENNLHLIVLSCAFSQLEKNLISSCIFQPMLRVSP